MTPRRRHTAAGLAAGLLAGSAASLLLLAPTLSSAAQSPDTPAPQSPPTTVADAPDDARVATDVVPVDNDGETGEGRADRLGEVLQPLVDDGTITQEQLDAVIVELAAATPVIGRGGVWLPGDGPWMQGGPWMPGGPGMPGGAGRHDGPWMILPGGLGALVEVIGIDATDLREQVRGGATLAEIATDNGVEPQAVIDALVARATEQIATAVTDGRVTQEEADERLAEITEAIKAWVYGESRAPDDAVTSTSEA